MKIFQFLKDIDFVENVKLLYSLGEGLVDFVKNFPHVKLVLIMSAIGSVSVWVATQIKKYR